MRAPVAVLAVGLGLWSARCAPRAASAPPPAAPTPPAAVEPAAPPPATEGDRVAPPAAAPADAPGTDPPCVAALGDDWSLGFTGRPVGRSTRGRPLRRRVPEGCFLEAPPRDEVRRTVVLHHGRVRRCYEEALRRTPRIEGRVTVSFEIDTSGLVRDARPTDDTTGDAELAGCVAEVIAGLRFPCSGEGARCSYGFLLRPSP